jgi:protease-4
VALVQARGAIASGRSRRGPSGRQLGSDSVSAELRAALEDDRAKAVLLQVDSPGGSAVASETIWREVCRVREAGKPVVVSMGAVAGSGGYYIACPADVIMALPATITGSIGVIGGKFVVRELLDRLGLTTGTVEQGARPLMYSGRRGFDDEERARLEALIDTVYADFVAKVAAGRHRDVEQIEAVARGRIWSGRDAVAIGLVDQLGGLREALTVARSRGGLPDDAPVLPAVHVTPLSRLGRPKNSDDPRALLSTWPELPSLATALQALDGIALRMPPITLR